MIYVAAYCRVSTEREDQANSFESQQRYFREYISRTEGWQLYKIYADEGLSGTSTKKRKAFKRMIDDAREGNFQMILTKEISRFARNTLDSIYFTRELKRYGVGVFFLNDNINTLDPDAELRLTILSSIAQEESRRTSERVKWGQKRRMEQGVVFGSSMLGYDVKNGQIYQNEEGAKVVCRIYDKFLLEGKGTYVIANELREEGILPLRAKKWSSSVILRILRNEKYCGDLLQKKTYTPDYLTHEKRYNYGEEEYVRVTNHHTPIISREVFNQVQVILDSRARKIASKERESNRYAFSGKILCGRCGRYYIARSRVRNDESLYLVWRCYHGGKGVDSDKVDVAGVDVAGVDVNSVCENDVIGNKVNRSNINENNIFEDNFFNDDNRYTNKVGLNFVDENNKVEKNRVCISTCIKNEELVEMIKKIATQLPINKEEFINQMMDLMKRCFARVEGYNEIQDKLVEIEDERRRLLLAYRKNYITEDEFVAARVECDQEEELYKGIMGRNVQGVFEGDEEVNEEITTEGNVEGNIESNKDEIKDDNKENNKDSKYRDSYVDGKNDINIAMAELNHDNMNYNDLNSNNPDYNNLIDREESIKKILEDIIYGIRFNDTVCQEIVDRIVRIALDTYDIYYKGVPHGWRVHLVNKE